MDFFHSTLRCLFKYSDTFRYGKKFQGNLEKVVSGSVYENFKTRFDG
ncbi:hypothetical protein LEP1GSC016_0141 [Leptospira borgpetersenii serovar Hardjo-bovis str. Sponselee]|uniref:Uncharacterized protein n=3 Tax=Leptospira borgpetersenii TaxID=174 RepID=M3HSX7_LEPBO|nr:hypothetical protein LEP1GSC123_1064 [Leptospira borgpetersenii str. 200701203]EMJ79234.1 hypothetical protein LEP1GSC016_0141 [Leptospira borgpetersenii serovar Hardjo-bovis str. Sponselee]EMO62713.1 hypothetical protein LEP1GSC133_3535 [Leptospira borgpetersenii serovar Pomona str. 200901868]